MSKSKMPKFCQTLFVYLKTSNTHPQHACNISAKFRIDAWNLWDRCWSLTSKLTRSTMPKFCQNCFFSSPKGHMHFFSDYRHEGINIWKFNYITPVSYLVMSTILYITCSLLCVNIFVMGYFSILSACLYYMSCPYNVKPS